MIEHILLLLAHIDAVTQSYRIRQIRVNFTLAHPYTKYLNFLYCWESLVFELPSFFYSDTGSLDFVPDRVNVINLVSPEIAFIE